MRPTTALWLCLLGLLLLGGCGKKSEGPVRDVRTVVVTPLEDRTPNPPFDVVGVAEPYRESEVSFEVSGRITMILDVGRSVEVRTWEAGGEAADGDGAAARTADGLMHLGDVIARIDDTSYRQRLDAARLRLETAQAGLKATVIDFEQVAPATVVRAESQRDAALSEAEGARAIIASFQSSKEQAERDLERSQSLYRDQRISRSELEQSQTAFDAALANLSQAQARLVSAQEEGAAYEAALTEAKASLRLKQENVARAQAEIAELEIAVEQASTDLERCTLRAPFSGRITEVLASNGDFVSAGKPVLTLTMIDPIKVSVTVSADRERQLQPGNYARVMPRRIGDYQEREALFGVIFEKGAVADPATRTFRIEVMVRNPRRLLGRDVEGAAHIRFRELLPAVERNVGEGGPLFVCDACCVPEGRDRYAVYRVPGIKFGAPREPLALEGPLDLQKIEVESSGRTQDDFMQILNWTFRAVEPRGDGPRLEDGDLLIAFGHLKPEDLAKGVVLDRYDWAIRPGDLVPVSFKGVQAHRGIWVPQAAIRVLGDRRSVFVVEEGKAREIPVEVFEGIAALRRIEGEGLRVGQRLIVVGVHYVYDGGDVSVIREVDLDDVIEVPE